MKIVVILLTILGFAFSLIGVAAPFITSEHSYTRVIMWLPYISLMAHFIPSIIIYRRNNISSFVLLVITTLLSLCFMIMAFAM